MVEKEYIPVATSDDPTFNLEGAALDGGDHLLVVQATDESGEVSAYSDETVYSQEYDIFAIEKTTMTAIADSVRAKTGKTDLIPTEEIPAEIASIETGITPTGAVDISSNGEHDVTAYAKANVNVPIPNGYIKPTGTKQITENGEHDVAQYQYAHVSIPEPTAEEMSVVPKTSSQTVIPINADYLSKVTVAAIPAKYIDSSEIGTSITGRPSTATVKGSWRFVPDVNITTNKLSAKVDFMYTYSDGETLYLAKCSQIDVGVEDRFVTFRSTLAPESPEGISEYIIAYVNGRWESWFSGVITFIGEQEVTADFMEALNNIADPLTTEEGMLSTIQELVTVSNSITESSDTDLVNAVFHLIRAAGTATTPIEE